MGQDLAAREAADEWSNKVIGAAIQVHRRLGPGLLESAYQACLCRELELRDIPFRPQVLLDIEYEGVVVKNAYRLDVVVADLVIVEIKAVHKLEAVHEAQLLTYLRLTNLWLGLVLNFNVPVLRDGIRRKVLN